MFEAKTRVREYRDVSPEMFRAEILPRYEPAVLRGVVDSWPAVEAGRQSGEALIDYTLQFDAGVRVGTFTGPPEINGYFFYRDDMRGFNFDRAEETYCQAVERIQSTANTPVDPPAVYLGSAVTRHVLPGFAERNPMPYVPQGVDGRIWIGTKAIVPLLVDTSNNIACAVSGQRRFTLIPSSQIGNLYVGPLEFTMAGQPVTMVDLHNPDFERYPKFAEALEHAQQTVLEPGDGIFIPRLWWHQVDSIGHINTLVNYWWDEFDRGTNLAFETMIMGILTIRDRDDAERETWRAMFDHYVFKKNGDPVEHLKPEHRGVQGEKNPQLIEMIRQFVIRSFQR